MYSNRKPAEGIITLSSGENRINYLIQCVKGMGGSSIVYEADGENGMKCIIKEFAPLKYSEYTHQRTDGHFRFPNQVMQDKSFIKEREQFINSCKLMNRLAFTEETAEESICSMLFYGEYGVPYIVMEWNPMRVVNIEAEKGFSLSDISEIALGIARTLREYHKMGLLHLDIKPENVLWSKKYRYIKLIDLGISADMNNSAPENVIGGNITSSTDIYALGALIFRLVTGRDVNPAFGDRTTFGYENTLGGLEVTKNASAKAMILLKKVLRGSICASPSKRMDDDSFIKALNELREAADTNNISLCGNMPVFAASSCPIHGESEKVLTLLSENSTVVIASQMLLTGKSTLARSYAHNFSSRYHTILFIDGRKDIFSQISFTYCKKTKDFDEAAVEEKKELLRSVADKCTLIIIDNLNDETFHEIYRFFSTLNGDVIITTSRTDIGGLPVYIKRPMTETEASNLYSAITDSRMPTWFFEHTMGIPAMVSEFAKLSICTPKNELSSLRQSLAKGCFTSSVIKEIIGFGYLSEKEILAVKCLSLIRTSMDMTEFSCMYNNGEQVKSLINKGWVSLYDGKISLSPIARIACCGEYSADSTSCRRMYRYLCRNATQDDAEYIGRRISGISSEAAELYCVCGDLLRHKQPETANKFYRRGLMIYSTKYGKDSAPAVETAHKITD